MDLCRLGDLERLLCGEQEWLLLPSLSLDWDLSWHLSWFSFPGCGPGLPMLPSCGAAVVVTHLESFQDREISI